MSSQTAAPAISASAASGGKKNFSTIALIVGLIGIAIGLVGLITGILAGDGRNGQSWLIGYAFWMAMLVGMLYLIQLWYLFDAGWPIIIRRQLEHAMAAFPWMFLLFLPVFVLPFLIGDNTGVFWKWMNPANIYPSNPPFPVGEDSLYLHKASYLNVPFMAVRILLYFAVFCGLAYFLRKFSFRNDIHADPGNVTAARKVSAAGVFLTSFAATFMAFDFFMSLSYHWFSTMYGVWFFSVAIRAALAGTIILCNILALRGHLKGLYNQSHNYFLGCLSLAFTIFWAYISFSQYFLIYNANIPEETFWFNIREMNEDGSTNSWWWVSMALIFFYFLAPFFALLAYKTKVVAKRLLFISAWILVFTLLDLYFNILPSKIKDSSAELGYAVKQFIPNVFDLAVLVGVGGICIWAMLRSMAKTQPIPIHDPRINESINSHE